jgi:glycerol-3-phosphate acyltransferase PlsX
LLIALDAMGGDHAPAEMVAGARLAVAELGVEVLLCGTESEIRACLPDGELTPGLELLATTEVIGMSDDPASSVRTRKDSSLVRAAQSVKEGRAAALVGAGNTGATMASALFAFGRIRGVARPAIGVPIPVPGGDHPQVLVDGGATVDCDPEWLHQFALLGGEYARLRYSVTAPKIGLLSNGEEPGKGDELRKKAFALLQDVPGFVGNVEGRDFLSADVDVIVTDGFTGNVALKTLEGAMRRIALLVFAVLDSTPEARAVAPVITPLLLDAASVLDPDATGGAMLLGLDGVCIISHGSSSARAIVNAIKVARDAVADGYIARLKEAVGAG